MKKFLSILCVVFLLLSFAGCSNNPSADTTTDPQNTTVAPETVSKPVITDYTLTGMMNVTDVFFDGAKSGETGLESSTYIIVYLKCPYCDYEGNFAKIPFSEISENLIGQQAFTVSKEISCGEYDKHDWRDNPDYKYSILFTLDN